MNLLVDCGCLLLPNICSHDTKLALGISFRDLGKAEKLQYKEALMTHAMVFVGVHLEVCADVASTAAYIHTTSICSVIAITCIVDQRVSFFVRFGSSFLERICCFSDCICRLWLNSVI